jgi:O-acetyl-ADP-ribose deacetylase (regulator of RNase III)
MIHLTGDMFTSDAPALGHGVNCAGVMGAGVAKTFRELYPHNYENYRAACQRKQLKPGMVHVNQENGKYLLNMASQNMPGADASYEWLFAAALAAARGAVKVGVDRVAIPEIGSHIGGLTWVNVEAVLETVEFIVNPKNDSLVFEWEVWHYDA